LIFTVLIAERNHIANRVATGGSLVLAGILTKEFAQVQSAFETAGFQLARKKREKEWTSGSFRKNK
jgi:ribosomal protein L11 methylase PrmA